MRKTERNSAALDAEQQSTILADTDTVKATKVELTKTALKLAGMLLIVCFAVAAYFSRAWFVSNQQVQASDAVTSVAGVESLFISTTDPTSNKKDYLASANGAMAGNLYPISTSDCINWYYASAWNNNAVSGDNEVSGYTKAEVGISVIKSVKEENTNSYTGTYTSSFGFDLTAYNRTDYWLYTSSGEVNVSLDWKNTQPITVAYNATKTTGDGKDLPGALRVAIVTWGENDTPVVQYVYTGQEKGCKAIAEVKEEETSTLKEVEATYEYSQDSSVSICTANEGGVKVSVFVWLEGTDAQAVLGVSDNETSLVSIGVCFTGAASEQQADTSEET